MDNIILAAMVGSAISLVAGICLRGKAFDVFALIVGVISVAALGWIIFN